MAQDRKVAGAGFQLIISSGRLSKAMESAVISGLADVAIQYKKQVIKNISLDDHTLEELRALGHPYSTLKPADTMHGDDRLVHEQTGALKRSIEVGAVEETTSRRFSVFATSNAPHMPWLIAGTSRMRARRFHEKAYEDIKDKFWKPLLEKLGKIDYRTQVTTKNI
jgi:hypothetical protein